MLTAFAQTNVGKTRSVNQDTIFASTEVLGPLSNLFIVADGMGGHKGGDIASREAIEHFNTYVRDCTDVSDDGILDLMTSAIRAANAGVFSRAADDDELSGMGTTMTACTVFGGKYYIVHIGDSRAYRITDEAIVQLTNDHSYVNEMVRAGQLTQNEAREHPKRNVLTRVLGINEEMSADGYVFEAEPGSVILLCSDGLFNMVQEDEIKHIVNTSDDPAVTLVETANDRGGTDNISVIVINING